MVSQRAVGTRLADNSEGHGKVQNTTLSTTEVTAKLSGADKFAGGRGRLPYPREPVWPTE